MKAWIIGFDLSLAAPAAAAIPIGWKPGSWRKVETSIIKPPSPATDDIEGQFKRYITIAAWAIGFVGRFAGGARGTARVFRESYGFNQNTKNGSRIMESGGVVCCDLYRRFGCVVRPVAASSARKFLLGFNPSKRTGHDAKVEVRAALYKAGASKKWDDNICDAFVVANFGLTEVGTVGLTVAKNVGKKRGAARR